MAVFVTTKEKGRKGKDQTTFLPFFLFLFFLFHSSFSLSFSLSPFLSFSLSLFLSFFFLFFSFGTCILFSLSFTFGLSQELKRENMDELRRKGGQEEPFGW